MKGEGRRNAMSRAPARGVWRAGLKPALLPSPHEVVRGVELLVDGGLALDGVAGRGTAAADGGVEVVHQVAQVAHGVAGLDARLWRAVTGRLGRGDVRLHVAAEGRPSVDIVRRIDEAADARAPRFRCPLGHTDARVVR